MKKIIIALILISIVFSCGKRQIQNPMLERISSDSSMITNKKSNIKIDKILNEFVSKVEQCTKKDSIFYPLGNTVMEEDTSRIIAVGRFIDGEKIFAVDISAPKNAIINFYCFENNKWENIGTQKSKNDIFKLDFKDYDGDNRNEIVAQGHFNMNGNFSNDFYYCSNKTKTVHHAGYFFAGVYDYLIDYKEKNIKVTYEGSWYATNSKTIYKWNDEKLIPIKSVKRGLKIADGKHDIEFIEYYENPTTYKDTLVLKFKKTYRENNDKLYSLWEHFLD